MPLPYEPIEDDPVINVPAPTVPSADLPVDQFPNLSRIVVTDLVGPLAANKQHKALDKRTLSLQQAIARISGVLAAVDTVYLRNDGATQKDSVAGIRGNMPMNGHKFTGMATGSAATDSANTGQVTTEAAARAAADANLDALKVAKAGDTMSGNLLFTGGATARVPTAADPADAVPLAQLEALVLGTRVVRDDPATQQFYVSPLTGGALRRGGGNHLMQQWRFPLFDGNRQRSRFRIDWVTFGDFNGSPRVANNIIGDYSDEIWLDFAIYPTSGGGSPIFGAWANERAIGQAYGVGSTGTDPWTPGGTIAGPALLDVLTEHTCRVAASHYNNTSWILDVLLPPVRSHVPSTAYLNMAWYFRSGSRDGNCPGPRIYIQP